MCAALLYRQRGSVWDQRVHYLDRRRVWRNRPVSKVNAALMGALMLTKLPP